LLYSTWIILEGDKKMKTFSSEEFIKMKNPNPSKPYQPDALTQEDQAKELGGLFSLLGPGSRVPYHYHNNRESIIIIISGKATEIVEGKEIPIKAGDILYLPAGERHATVNTSDKDVRYFEFFTRPPRQADFVEVK
jgi:quercetin dioxygenase-like cupin family protein